jgi:hypothetical protein
MKKALIITGVVVGLLGGAVAVGPRLLFGDGHDYSHAISIKTLAAYQDPALMDKAWALPVAALYHKEGVDYQRNGSFCGPTSAVNVMRSLGQSANQGTILDDTGIKTTFGMVFGGLTLDEEAGVIEKKTGKKVTKLRDLTVEQLREELTHANDPSRRYIVNFHRGPLFGTGGGHHSPIAGYLAQEDLVLVLDVNEKYKPWLVPTARLQEAIDTVDKQSGQKRGLLRIE